MRRLRAWMWRLGASFARSRHAREMAAELESHLQLHIDDNVRAGMSPDAVRRHAVLALGGVEATKERYRDRRGIPLLDALRQDLVYAFRTLRKSPSFSAVAIGTLALGIGANTAIFSLVYAALLRPLPFSDPSRIMPIFGTNVERGYQYDVSSYPTFLERQAQNHSVESMAACTNRQLVLGVGNDFVLGRGKAVTPNVFDVLSVKPALGRTFSDFRSLTDLLSRVHAIPGVVATETSNMPTDGGIGGDIDIPGRSHSGRFLGETGVGTASKVAVVNEALKGDVARPASA